MKPAVTVIVPSYNKPEYLVECLRSIRAQTFEDWECIVVSDGSPRVDEIRATVEGMRDARFRLVEHAENRGLAAARNTGIREARADLVICVDEDDRLRQDCLLVLLRELIAGKAEVVCPQGRFFGGADRRRSCKVPSIEEILVGQPLLPAGSLIKRQVFERIGEYDESDMIRLGREDHEWWIRAVSCGVRISVVDEELYYIRRAGMDYELAKSLDFNACRNEYSIYRYIARKHESIYACHAGCKREVLRSALMREASRLEWEGRQMKAVYRRWQAVLLARRGEDVGKAIKASVKIILPRGWVNAVRLRLGNW